MLGITEDELDQQCDELFAETPVKFAPKKNNQVDLRIAQYLYELGVTIPVVHIKNSLYLIGSNRTNCHEVNGKLVVTVGGGYEKFEDYVMANNRYLQRMLVVHMIKSGESLEWVIEQLIAGKKIKNIHLEAQNKEIEAKKFRHSATGSPRLSVSPKAGTGGLYRDFSGRKSLSPNRVSYKSLKKSSKLISPIAKTKISSTDMIGADEHFAKHLAGVIDKNFTKQETADFSQISIGGQSEH